MKFKLSIAAVIIAASSSILAACGGGGGGNPIGGPPPTINPTPTPTPTPSITTASGTVVDDKTGAPLSGVKVVLMPWGPCGATPSPATSITPENDGCPTPLPSPQPTTDANGNFTLANIPNGHYLLVIGNDVTYTPPPGYAPPTCTSNCGTPTPAPFTVQATVHDNITLVGGNQTLKAPTLPSNSYYAAPTWETNGNYRLATLDASTEMPCYIQWEYLRAQNNLPGASVDEWLTENVRADNTADYKGPAGTTTSTLSDYHAYGSAGTACQDFLTQSMFGNGGNPYAMDARALWFGGQYQPYVGGSYSAAFLAEFPIDPRSNTDPQQPTWP